MNKLPSVTVITPTIAGREEHLERCLAYCAAQDYQGEIQHLYSDEQMTTGAKRNLLVSQAKGDIIIHMDDDDYYGSDWIRKSVNHLLTTKADTTGLSKAYFFRPPHNLRLYDRSKTPGQIYVLGATLCYWKRVWENNPFKDVRVAEDKYFCAMAGRISPHDHNDNFMVMIHGNNTSSQEAFKTMTPVNNLIARDILKSQYETYVQGQPAI